uniref:RNA methyltransferase n=1 Tax=Rhabditophanes sp. KR3021 TaxID=114890 RepID=A0AC35TWM9_9BILA
MEISIVPDKQTTETSDISASNSTTSSTNCVPSKKKENLAFRYGNYNRYYGRRKPDEATKMDPRLLLIPKTVFEKKKVLDIGCNVGPVTLAIAKHYAPQMILGIDIDSSLIGVARKNIRHYCEKDVKIEGLYPASFFKNADVAKEDKPTEFFKADFPDNVWFQHENYVLPTDTHLEGVEEEYNVIVAFSLTKWVHLNFGDDGLKRFFLRAFKHLLPGGKFLLESQAYSTYYKKAKQHPELLKTYKELKFKPGDFKDYLLNVVGFKSYEVVGENDGKSTYGRTIEIFTKDSKFISSRKRKNVGVISIEASIEPEVGPTKVAKAIKFADSDEEDN